MLELLFATKNIFLLVDDTEYETLHQQTDDAKEKKDPEKSFHDFVLISLLGKFYTRHPLHRLTLMLLLCLLLFLL